MLHNTLLQARPVVGPPTTANANGYTLEITVSEPHLSQLKKAGYVLCLGIKCDWPSGAVPNGGGGGGDASGAAPATVVTRRVEARNGGYVVWYARGGYMSHNLFKWYDRFEVRCFGLQSASSSSSSSAGCYSSPASASSLLDHSTLGSVGDGFCSSSSGGNAGYGEELGKCEVTPGQTLLITSRGLSISPTHREDVLSKPGATTTSTYISSSSSGSGGPGREIRILNTLSGSRSVRLEFWQVLGERLVNIYECVVPPAQPQLQLHSQVPLLAPPFLTGPSSTSSSTTCSSSTSTSSRSCSPSPASFQAQTQSQAQSLSSTPNFNKQGLVLTPGKITLGPPANVIRMWWERPSSSSSSSSTSLSPLAHQCFISSTTSFNGGLSSSSPSSSPSIIMEEQGRPFASLAQGQFEVQVGSSSTSGGGGEVRVGFGNGTVGVGSGGLSGMGALGSGRGRWELR